MQYRYLTPEVVQQIKQEERQERFSQVAPQIYAVVELCLTSRYKMDEEEITDAVLTVLKPPKSHLREFRTFIAPIYQQAVKDQQRIKAVQEALHFKNPQARASATARLTPTEKER
jgi:hypothetical protein